MARKNRQIPLDEHHPLHVGKVTSSDRRANHYDEYVARAKLYTTNTPITSTDLLNDQVLSFYAEQGLPVLHIMTDRAAEYYSEPDKHEYQLFPTVNVIDHTKTKVKHPQTNGICERFHKIFLQEFYQLAFRKNLYETVEQL